MSTHFQGLPITEIADIISGGTPNTKNQAFWNGNIPWLSVADFNTGNRRVYQTEKRITDLGLKESPTRLLEYGDIIISARGTVGAMAQVGLPMAFNQSCYGLRGKNKVADTNYLYYSLKYVISDLQKLSHGAVFDTITRDTFSLISVPLPPLPEQRRIAHILGTLDDKIENNRKTAKTLEAMAQAIFQSWFVDFDPVRAKIAGESSESICKRLKLTPEILNLFTDRLVDSELGEIPDGWEVSQIGKFGDLVCGKTPSKATPEYFGDGIPFIKIPDMHNDVFVVKPSERLTPFGAASQANKTIPPGSICVSCIATVGKVVITHEPSQTNQQINSIIPKSAEYTAYLYFQMSGSEVEFHNLASAGSTTLNMNTSTFSKVRILMPTIEILRIFSFFVVPLFSEILLSQKQAKNLSDIRDALLPKLISGKIRVPDAEHLIKEAAE